MSGRLLSSLQWKTYLRALTLPSGSLLASILLTLPSLLYPSPPLPLVQLGGLRDHCKLPQHGLEWSPGCQCILDHIDSWKHIWWQQIWILFLLLYQLGGGGVASPIDRLDEAMAYHIGPLHLPPTNRDGNQKENGIYRGVGIKWQNNFYPERNWERSYGNGREVKQRSHSTINQFHHLSLLVYTRYITVLSKHNEAFHSTGFTMSTHTAIRTQYAKQTRSFHGTYGSSLIIYQLHRDTGSATQPMPYHF